MPAISLSASSAWSRQIAWSVRPGRIVRIVRNVRIVRIVQIVQIDRLGVIAVLAESARHGWTVRIAAGTARSATIATDVGMVAEVEIGSVAGLDQLLGRSPAVPPTRTLTLDSIERRRCLRRPMGHGSAGSMWRAMEDIFDSPPTAICPIRPIRSYRRRLCVSIRFGAVISLRFRTARTSAVVRW